MNKIAEAISELVQTFTVSVGVFLFLYFLIAFPEKVDGASMEPTLHGGERLIVERLSVRFNKLDRGDVVIFNPPSSDNIDYVKRIVGLPGEKLLIENCEVYLFDRKNNKVKIPEPYLKSGECSRVVGEGVVYIPSDSYFVMGDNRQASADSRVFGAVQKDRVDGKVFLRFWPLDKFSLLKNAENLYTQVQ